ncbi:phosphoglycerate mutase [Marininema mesophilum]|uniref:Phosphoglycerate mutase n=1 Tax=Marininema mesophilum TaxID=1048340 RepID=A0A1H3C1F5_9BACL|nr:histidine phosphatase family protein [Marininema mesophilum]SDX47881.1 phosphoglycerate mutase [Marininema mesophilum]
METQVYLIRHGETDWNKEKRVQGHVDIPLSSIGIEQARCLAERFVGEGLHGIYTSDLQRAVETAQTIAKRAEAPLSVQAYKDLRERDMGEWEGSLVADIKAQHPGAWERVWHDGGEFGLESTEDLKGRILHRLEKLVRNHPGERIAVVSHGGGINSVLAAISQGIHGPRTQIGNTSVTHLIFHPQTGWRIHRIGCMNHLQEGGTPLASERSRS